MNFYLINVRYDVAFRAGDEPQYPGRADFLTESILNSTMVYEALKEGRLAPAQVKAPWHRSIASTLERLDEDFRSDPRKLMEHLQDFNISGDDVLSMFANSSELHANSWYRISHSRLISSQKRSSPKRERLIIVWKL
jgi:hypothetical protein